MRYQAALHTEARRIPKPEIRAKVSSVLSVNARPLRNTLTQQAEARHDGHQQKKQKERSERFALDRIDAPLKKSIDFGLIGVRELLRRVRIRFLVAVVHGFTPLPETTLYRVIRMTPSV